MRYAALWSEVGVVPGVQVRVTNGPTLWLGPGELIGRNPVAGLTLDDASVSEAHALVSLRGGRFVLLGLRGVFTVDAGTPPSSGWSCGPGRPCAYLEMPCCTSKTSACPTPSGGLWGRMGRPSSWLPRGRWWPKATAG